MGRLHQMPAHAKQVVYRSIGGEKTLRVGGGLEPPHLPFALPDSDSPNKDLMSL